MANNAILWQTTNTNRTAANGTIFSSSLDSLASAGYSVTGSVIDNTVNLDQFGAIDLALGTIAPGTGSYVSIYLQQALDGTNYENPPTVGNPASHQLVATISITSGSSAKRVATPFFRLPPSKMTFSLYNGTNVSLAASANSGSLWTNNDEVQ